MSKLKENIDRILGNSIRCLLPSYWWKRLFGLVVDEVDKVKNSVGTLEDGYKALEESKADADAFIMLETTELDRMEYGAVYLVRGQRDSLKVNFWEYKSPRPDVLNWTIWFSNKTSLEVTSNGVAFQWEGGTPTIDLSDLNPNSLYRLDCTLVTVGASGTTVKYVKQVARIVEYGASDKYDTFVSETSTNAVQNKIIKGYVDKISYKVLDLTDVNSHSTLIAAIKEIGLLTTDGPAYAPPVYISKGPFSSSGWVTKMNGTLQYVELNYETSDGTIYFVRSSSGGTGTYVAFATQNAYVSLNTEESNLKNQNKKVFSGTNYSADASTFKVSFSGEYYTPVYGNANFNYSTGSYDSYDIVVYRNNQYETWVLNSDGSSYLKEVNTTSVISDSEMSSTSTNPLQNKVVTEKLAELSAEIGTHFGTKLLYGGAAYTSFPCRLYPGMTIVSMGVSTAVYLKTKDGKSFNVYSVPYTIEEEIVAFQVDTESEGEVVVSGEFQSEIKQLNNNISSIETDIQDVRQGLDNCETQTQEIITKIGKEYRLESIGSYSSIFVGQVLPAGAIVKNNGIPLILAEKKSGMVGRIDLATGANVTLPNDITHIQTSNVAGNVDFEIVSNFVKKSELSDSIQEVLLDYTIDTKNLGDKSVTIDKVAFAEVGKNLLDNQKYKQGLLFNGKIYDSTENYRSYLTSDYIAVESGKTYTFSCNGIKGWLNRAEVYDSQYGFLADILSSGLTMPENAAFFRFSLQTTPDSEDWQTAQFEMGDVATPYEPYCVVLSQSVLPNNVKAYAPKPYLSQYADVLNSGESIEIADAPNSKNHHTIGCGMGIISMGKIRITHGLSQNAFGMVEIDDTNVYEYAVGNAETPTKITPHGLDIQDFVRVAIIVGVVPYSANIILTSLTGEYTQQISWNGCNQSVVLSAISGQYQNISLTMSGGGFKKDIWFCGDSYVDHWLPKLYAREKTDFYADGYSGRQTDTAYNSFLNALKLGTPKILVWAMGMNDGDGSSINASYKRAFDAVKELCNQKGIAFVPCTIPNCPTITHTYKNEYIRVNSDNYIDMAKILGADNEGSTWYEGLLSTDNVHPSNIGDMIIANVFIEQIL